MGIDSISEVCPEVESKEMLAVLNKCKDKHQRLQKEIECELSRFQDDGKNPNPIAKSMSSMKTNLKMAMKHCDKTVADLHACGGAHGIGCFCKQAAILQRDPLQLPHRSGLSDSGPPADSPRRGQSPCDDLPPGTLHRYAYLAWKAHFPK